MKLKGNFINSIMSFCTTLFLAVGIVSVASQEAPSIASDGNGNIVIDVRYSM